MYPFTFSSRSYDSGTPQVCQMPRDLWLVSLEDLYEEADADLAIIHQIQQSQPRPIR